jgi:hypothetical protein
VTGGWRTLHEDLHNFHLSQTKYQVKEMDGLRSSEERNQRYVHNFLLESLKGEDNSEHLGANWRTILTWTLRKQGWKL